MVWKKGQSGNPSGRPPRNKALTELLRARAASKGADRRRNDDALVDLIWREALQGERWAVEMIWDRLEGRPAQRNVLAGDDDAPLYFVTRDPREHSSS